MTGVIMFLWWWGHAAAAPKPAPGLSPDAVIRTVVAALQNFDSPLPNAGAYTAYQFASPANHAITGPYGHFLRLVKSAEFTPLTRRLPVEFGPVEVHGDSASGMVTVLPASRFRFTLGRQHAGSCPNCWMVDGVVAETRR